MSYIKSLALRQKHAAERDGRWRCVDDDERCMQNRGMTEPGDLNDEELLNRAHQLRLLALRGHFEARGPAHQHEAEVRRRFGVPTTLAAPLEPAHTRRRPFWRFW